MDQSITPQLIQKNTVATAWRRAFPSPLLRVAWNVTQPTPLTTSAMSNTKSKHAVRQVMTTSSAIQTTQRIYNVAEVRRTPTCIILTVLNRSNQSVESHQERNFKFQRTSMLSKPLIFTGKMMKYAPTS